MAEADALLAPLAVSRTTVPSAAALRLARLADAPAIAALYQQARRGGAPAELGDWLENGGALLLEDEAGRLVSALLWREEPRRDEAGRAAGAVWRLDRLATLEDFRGQGFGRWMMTKVEALAIRENVALLTLELGWGRDDLLHYYTRMGYRQDDHGGEHLRLSKPVGGTWQIKGRG